MFASLLAASLASRRGRVGCTRTDADMYAGRAMPNGSRSLPGTADTEFERPLTVVGGTNAEAESGSPRGWGAGEGAEEGGPEAWSGEMGVCAVCEGAGDDGTGGNPAVAGFVKPADAKGDEGGLTNIDFVPSTRRPPSGGPSMTGVVNEACEAGDDD